MFLHLEEKNVPKFDKKSVKILNNQSELETKQISYFYDFSFILSLH